MDADAKRAETPVREEIGRIKEEFAAEMRGLRRRQRAAVENALKAVDRKRIEKIKKSLADGS